MSYFYKICHDFLIHSHPQFGPFSHSHFSVKLPIRISIPHSIFLSVWLSTNLVNLFSQVTCYCGKPFAGRPMVECSKCLTWIHLKCAGLRRTNIPDTWHCAKCKKHKSEASAVVSGSRKRKSTKQVQHLKQTEES